MVQGWGENTQRGMFQLKDRVFHVVDSVRPPGDNEDSVDGAIEGAQVLTHVASFKVLFGKNNTGVTNLGIWQ